MWWCKFYNKPMKDSTLQSYTLDELAYEYYTFSEQAELEEERTEHENDKIEQENIDNALAWAEEEEARDREIEQQALGTEEEPPDPTKDPENIKWMEEQIQKAKETYGDTFGEDISESFDD